MLTRSPGTLTREASPGKSVTPELRQETIVPFCSSMHVGAYFCQSPANVTGDSTLVQCDSPPVTLGNAGSYDSFRVTLGLSWLFGQASIQGTES